MLLAVVFLGFELGLERIIEPVDHGEHAGIQRNLDDLGVAEQAAYLLPNRLVALGSVLRHFRRPPECRFFALVKERAVAIIVALKCVELGVGKSQCLTKHSIVFGSVSAAVER